MVIAFAADEGQDIVGAGVAADVEQKRRGVEGDGERVGREGTDKPCGRGIGAPVDGVDSHAVATANHGDGTTVVAHRVVAHRDAKVGAVLGRTQVGATSKVSVGDAPTDNVCSHHATIVGRVETLHQVHHGGSPLAETRQDERLPLVEVGQIIGKSAAHIGQGKGQPAVNKTIGGKSLEGTLAVVGRIEIEVAAEDVVHPLHLAIEEGADAVVVGVGKVARLRAESIVASLGGDDVENVDRGVSVGHIPLRGIRIGGRPRNHRDGTNRLRLAARDCHYGGQCKQRNSKKACKRTFYSHNLLYC